MKASLWVIPLMVRFGKGRTQLFASFTQKMIRDLRTDHVPAILAYLTHIIIMIRNLCGLTVQWRFSFSGKRIVRFTFGCLWHTCVNSVNFLFISLEEFRSCSFWIIFFSFNNFCLTPSILARRRSKTARTRSRRFARIFATFGETSSDSELHGFAGDDINYERDSNWNCECSIHQIWWNLFCLSPQTQIGRQDQKEQGSEG